MQIQVKWLMKSPACSASASGHFSSEYVRDWHSPGQQDGKWTGHEDTGHRETLQEITRSLLAYSEQFPNLKTLIIEKDLYFSNV